MKRALALLLCSFPVFADPPFLPVAQCDQGSCVLKQSDYETLQRFHADLVRSMIQTQSENAQLENAVAELKQKLVRQSLCQGWKI